MRKIPAALNVQFDALLVKKRRRGVKSFLLTIEPLVSIDQKSFISPLTKITHPTISAIKSGRVGNIEVAHKFRKVAFRGGYQ